MELSRKHLLSRDADVIVDLDEMRGVILVGGVRPGGSFTIVEVPSAGRCAECGHPLSQHTTAGCRVCACQQMWDQEQEDSFAAEMEG